MAINEASAELRLEAVYTIGVYGFTADQFVSRLGHAGVGALVDVRLRRGVRGAAYAWANARRLQDRLKTEGIAYHHAHDLAPTPELRAIQSASDAQSGTAKRTRAVLSHEFAQAYERAILRAYDPADTAARLERLGNAVALFCVEGAPAACHRSLVAEWLRREGVVRNVLHLLP